MGVTESFTVDFVWQAGVDYLDLKDVEDVSFRLLTTFSDQDEGILFEAAPAGLLVPAL